MVAKCIHRSFMSCYFLSHLRVGRSWQRDFQAHYIILGWWQVLTSVTPTHDCGKDRTEPEIVVGCVGFSLKTPEEESTVIQQASADGAGPAGTMADAFPTCKSPFEIFLKPQGTFY